MPNTGMLVLSLICVVMGVGLFLSPHFLLEVSLRLNRTHGPLDQKLIRHRYLMGFLTFGASYAFFKLALLLPSLKG